uniref:Uncharacterized protein n=1 Tax=viral metagenome TaxID=1070528 RepID=A0A6C0DCG3_9ZZZZ
MTTRRWLTSFSPSMFVYGIRCTSSQFALPSSLSDTITTLPQHNLLVLPRLTQSAALRSWTPSLTENFRQYCQQFVERNADSWEVEWLEQPYLSSEEFSALRTCSSGTPSWYYVPAPAL